MKQRLMALFGSMMSAIIALLGFSGCDERYDPDMYGSPHGDFQFSGLVTDEEGQPLDKARVIVSISKDDNGNYFSIPLNCDTVYSDKKGNYSGEMKSILTEEAMILCEDSSGEFKPDSAIVTLKYEGKDKHKDDVWYIGTATAKVNFKLKKASGEEGK